MKEFISKRHIVYFAKLVAFFLIYFITAKLGLKLDAVSGFATLVWPPTGIAIAIILIFGYEYWPAILFGAFLVNFTTGASMLVALGIGLGNMFEAVLGIFLLKKFGFILNERNLRNTLLFIFFGSILNTAFAATVGVSSLWLGGMVSSLSYKVTWVAWWVGDALGALIVGNLIITLKGKASFRNIKKARTAEKIFFLCILVVSNLFIFTNIFGAKTIGANNPILVYTIFPLLIWASIRFGRSGAALTVFITSVISVWGTVLGQGPFSMGNLSYNLLLLQGYIGVIAGTSMILAAVMYERFKAENELITEKNKDKAILESIGDGVVVIDTNGIIIMINHSAQIMLGVVELHEAIGRNYEKILQIEDKTEKLLAIKDRPSTLALSTNKVVTDHYYFRLRNNRKLPVILTTAPIIFEERVVGVIDVFRDVTHEQEVDKAKSEFISLASHQLRTPLTTMKWYSDALLKENAENLSLKQKEYTEEIYHNNQRMIDLVNALLNVSRIELGTFIIRPEILNIREIADEVIHDINPYAKNKKISIQKEYDPDTPLIKVDRNLARIVFQNLIANSIKYSKENSVVNIRIKIKEDRVLFIVADTGCGIPKEQQNKIFTKLFRADNARSIDGEGNGLGLYIVKSVMDQSGGQIWFESEIKKGSIFYASFPLSGMTLRETGHTLVAL